MPDRRKTAAHVLAIALAGGALFAVIGAVLLQQPVRPAYRIALMVELGLLLAVALTVAGRALWAMIGPPDAAEAAAEALKEALARAHAEHAEAAAEQIALEEARRAELMLIEAPPAGEPVAPGDRILIVDDNAANRTVLQAILDHLGVEWVSVADGQQALDAVRGEAFAAILMDIQMPVMDGLTATRKIRGFERLAGRVESPVIIVSAHHDAEDIAAGRAAGAQRHLPKPVSVRTLVGALNGVVAGVAGVSAAA